MTDIPESPGTDPSLADVRLMDASELGKLLGRSTTSIKIDVYRRPNTLPPRFQIPGTAKIQWRVGDVRRWLVALGNLMEQQRLAQHQLMARAGLKGPLPLKPVHLGSRDVINALTGGKPLL